VYRRWPDEVQARVPADRLLVYDVADGWEPLGRFLGRDVPGEPFPSCAGLSRILTATRLPRGQSGTNRP
jgi:hypothetical protein